MDFARRFVREPNAEDPERFGRRVRALARIYAALFATSLLGLFLLAWQAKLYVALAQRSNVETLTLALALAMFLILAAMSLPGARGAWASGRAALAARRAGAPAGERLKAELCERRGRRDEPVVVVLNAALARAEGGTPLVFRVGDEAGDLGSILVDGAVLRHQRGFASGSNSLLAFFVDQVSAAVARRGEKPWLEIVCWDRIDSEAAAGFASLVSFARALERKLEAPLWPRVELGAEDERFIAERLAEIVPSARQEALLPDWEYSGEHKLPIVPEPLGFLTLSRTESRVDPVSSMAMMLAVVVLSVLALAVMAVFPPWTPAR